MGGASKTLYIRLGSLLQEIVGLWGFGFRDRDLGFRV